jgi:endonuclease III
MTITLKIEKLKKLLANLFRVAYLRLVNFENRKAKKIQVYLKKLVTSLTKEHPRPVNN